jgi:hypothetical protein
MSKKKEKDEEEIKPPKLDIEEDMNFQRKSWAFQRFGWVLFALIVLGGLLGLLGEGPLSKTTVTGQSGFRIEYDRFTHRASGTDITINPGDAPISSEGTIEIEFSQDFLKDYTIDRSIPEPDSESLSGDKLVYSYKVDDGGPAQIVLHIQPEKAGIYHAEIGIKDADAVTIDQIIYP